MTDSPHLDDSTLINFVDGLIDAPDEVARIRRHLQDCLECHETAQEYRELQSVIREGRVPALTGDPSDEPDAAGLADVLAYAEELRQEEARAAVIVPPILAEDPTHWGSLVAGSTDYRRPMVVRNLLTAAQGELERQPARALAIATLASDIADHITPGAFRADIVLYCRGSAWKERANALRYLGRYPEALQALDRAEEWFAQTVNPELDLAVLDYIRAWVVAQLDRTDEALRLARRCATTFMRYGDLERENHAGLLEAAILFDRREFTKSRDAFLALRGAIQAQGHLPTLARLYSNLGNVLAELGDLDASGKYLHQAMKLFEELGLTTERVRVRWILGRIMVQAGRSNEALVMLDQVAAEFDALEMVDEAGCAQLLRAETLLALGQPATVPALCRALIDRFARIGAHHSALAALAFLREASERGPVTPQVVRHVRVFLEALRTHPDRVFVPPPTDPAA